MITSCAENPVTHFHILTANQDKEEFQYYPSITGISVGIRQIKLPAYLDRPQIVTRIGENELSLSYTHQWAEPLLQSISRVLNKELGARLPNANISTYPWSLTQAHDAEIRIHINRFEIVDHQNCVLDAKWWITTTGKETLHTDQSTITIAVNKKAYPAFVTAQSLALKELTSHIANRLSILFAKSYPDAK